MRVAVAASLQPQPACNRKYQRTYNNGHQRSLALVLAACGQNQRQRTQSTTLLEAKKRRHCGNAKEEI
jgi:hypothetical protein